MIKSLYSVSLPPNVGIFIEEYQKILKMEPLKVENMITTFIPSFNMKNFIAVTFKGEDIKDKEV